MISGNDWSTGKFIDPECLSVCLGHCGGEQNDAHFEVTSWHAANEAINERMRMLLMTTHLNWIELMNFRCNKRAHLIDTKQSISSQGCRCRFHINRRGVTALHWLLMLCNTFTVRRGLCFAYAKSSSFT